MFFKIGVLKSFSNFTGKHLCWSLFLKNLQADGLHCHKKDSNTGVFLWSLRNIFGCYFCTSGGYFYIFFKKVLLNSCFATLLRRISMDVLTIFSSRHIVWCIKSRTLLFINLSSIFRFLNNSVRVYSIKLKIGTLDHMNKTFRNTVF